MDSVSSYSTILIDLLFFLFLIALMCAYMHVYTCTYVFVCGLL